MKVILAWFNIVELQKLTELSFRGEYISIPMLELPILNKRQYTYLNPLYRKVYLGTYRKFTKKL